MKRGLIIAGPYVPEVLGSYVPEVPRVRVWGVGTENISMLPFNPPPLKAPTELM